MGKLFQLALEQAVETQPEVVEEIPVEELVNNAEELAKTDGEIAQDVQAVEDLMEEKAKLEDQVATNDELLSNPDAVVTAADVEVSEECRSEVHYHLGYTSGVSKIRLSTESVYQDVKSHPRKYLAISNEDIKETIKKIWEKIKAFFKRIWSKIKGYGVLVRSKLTGKYKKAYGEKPGTEVSEEVFNKILEQIKTTWNPIMILNFADEIKGGGGAEFYSKNHCYSAITKRFKAYEKQFIDICKYLENRLYSSNYPDKDFRKVEEATNVQSRLNKLFDLLNVLEESSLNTGYDIFDRASSAAAADSHETEGGRHTIYATSHRHAYCLSIDNKYITSMTHNKGEKPSIVVGKLTSYTVDFNVAPYFKEEIYRKAAENLIKKAASLEPAFKRDSDADCKIAAATMENLFELLPREAEKALKSVDDEYVITNLSTWYNPKIFIEKFQCATYINAAMLETIALIPKAK